MVAIAHHETDRNKPIYENNLAEEARESLSMDGYPEGNYHWMVQGLALKSFWSTWRIRLLFQDLFSVRKLRPVNLGYPGNNAGFEGLLAYWEPAALHRSSTTPVGTSRFILSRRNDFTGPPVVLINNPFQQIILPRLRTGDYYWTIRAEIIDSFGISAKAPRRFRVLPIPPLPTAAKRLPEDRKVLGAAELRTNHRIVFSWDAVADATEYLFTLEFITNNRKMSADVVDVYRRRWQIELFLKWLKQNLKIKSF
jgi:hypothetical protein